MLSPSVVLATMLRRGLIRVGAPHRTAAQLASLALWGASLAGEVRQAAKASPSRVAIVDETRGETTYAGLWLRSMRTAHVVQDLLGAAEQAGGGRLGLLARNHVGAVEVMVAASALGIDLVLANTGFSGEQLAAMVDDQGIDLLIHDDDFGEVCAHLRDGIRTVSESELAARVDAQPDDGDVTRPDQAGRTIILTSGTTGRPKGAARKTPGGIGPLISIIERIPLNVGDRVLIAAPIFHTWGFAAMQLCFGMRATIVMQRRFAPETAVAALAEHRCHGMFAVPVMLQRILEQVPPTQTASARRALRVVATSGSAYPHGFTTRFMDAYGDVLYNLYGSTEASWVCIATPADLRRHPGTAGRPPIGTVVRILDEQGEEVPDGDTGRIFCGNDLVFEGYTSGGTKEFQDGLVSTGDMGHVEDGLYFVDGRDDDMVISGGENVYPSEVESLLVGHPDIREVAVVGVPDPEFGQRLAAFVALVEGAQCSGEQVRQFVREHGARHHVPREVVFLDELPRNTTGKVLARELRAHFE